MPLASGGRLARWTYGGGWSGPAGWVPPGEVIGLRLLSGVVHVSSVDVDDGVRQRGEQLAARIKERVATSSYDGYRRHEVATVLLRMCHEDDDVLRQPATPLRRLFPAQPPDTRLDWPAGGLHTRSVQVALSPQVYEGLVEAADEAGLPVSTWVADELARLYAWPRQPWPERYGRSTGSWLDDDPEPDRRSLSVVRLDRPRQ